MVAVKKFTFNPFMENTYILFDETRECVIVDPGCYYEEEEKMMIDFITENKLIPVKLLHTHSHLDHVFGSGFIAEKYQLDLWIHDKDQKTLQAFNLSANMYGVPIRINPPEKYHFFDMEKGIGFGDSHLEIRFVPGHAPGHVVFISKDSNFVINGDCLFDGSIGRTDLPGGDHATLIRCIKEQLFTLNDDYLVYCGHGEETTIGKEKSTNPFLT